MAEYPTPDQLYAELFEAVQSGHLFADSKTFVDAVPKTDAATINRAFREQVGQPGFALPAFVEANFDLPATTASGLAPDSGRPVRDHIEQLWGLLTRVAENDNPNASLIALPHPFIVPGGRFREIYYWDSYFTLLGLAASGRTDLVAHMVANFAYLIDTIGFIPNGNRSYFCTRSQLPLFALMVELLAETTGDENVYRRFLPQLEQEYRFWMDGSAQLTDNLSTARRVVAVDGGHLNRFWDDSDLPRQESHSEDLALAARSARPAAELYRDLRAACESGWDFSARWLADPQDLGSIRTTEVIPVDLNAVMYKLESVLAHSHRLQGDKQRAARFTERAAQRRHLLQTRFFDAQTGCFTDLLLPDLRPSTTLSLAMAYPFFFELATRRQAQQFAQKMQSAFLKPGGWVTTLIDSGQQWDSPNGWAPLQWVTYTGLCNYGFTAEARAGARRWVDNNLAVYGSTGKLLEKYNVEQVGRIAGGGEYAVQDGFGWTNGVLLRFMDQLGIP
ncbi:alpha,alpha-trehalase TreA [Exilibacterium tricleocarpae]|nr:alpha,alpha-trehalase TreA [Exilibacterium tricleocarpae]